MTVMRFTTDKISRHLITGPDPLAGETLGVGGGRGEEEEGLDGGGARTTREAEAGGQEEHGRDR